MRHVEQAAAEGVQPADLLNGVIEFLRDVMVLAAGAGGALLAATPRQRPRLEAVVERWPIDTVLAALQVLDEYRGRLRGSPHGRTLVELALAKVSRLENMGELSELISRLAALEAGPGATAAPWSGWRQEGQIAPAGSPPAGTASAVPQCGQVNAVDMATPWSASGFGAARGR